MFKTLFNLSISPTEFTTNT